MSKKEELQLIKPLMKFFGASFWNLQNLSSLRKFFAIFQFLLKFCWYCQIVCSFTFQKLKRKFKNHFHTSYSVKFTKAPFFEDFSCFFPIIRIISDVTGWKMGILNFNFFIMFGNKWTTFGQNLKVIPFPIQKLWGRGT